MFNQLETLMEVKRIVTKACPELKDLEFGCFVHVQKGRHWQLLRVLMQKKISESPCILLMAEDGDVMWIRKSDFHAGMQKKQIMIIGNPVLLSHVLKTFKKKKIKLSVSERGKSDFFDWDLQIPQLEGQESIVAEKILKNLTLKK